MKDAARPAAEDPLVELAARAAGLGVLDERVVVDVLAPMGHVEAVQGAGPAGAGVHVQEVNRLLNQFEQMRDMMKKMKGGGLMKMMKRMGGLKGMGGMGGTGGMGGIGGPR